MVASFTVEAGDQLVLVTDNGQMIRTTVDDIRIAGRSTRGVIVFRVAEDEKVVSVSWLRDDDEEDENAENIEGTEATVGGDALDQSEFADDAESGDTEPDDEDKEADGGADE